ncbi:MAG: hypothetical protein AB1762_18470 [Gemmatimonadota bacterium]
MPACRIVTNGDPPDPPTLRIVIEPDTVRTRQDIQQRTVIVMSVRTFNDGPGDLFIPDCGHRLERQAPNGTWEQVHFVGCTNALPPFHVEAGGTFGYIIRVVAPADSAPWRRGTIDGQYRIVNYISAEFRPRGAWGRPIPLAQRTSAPFAIREGHPNEPMGS